MFVGFGIIRDHAIKVADCLTKYGTSMISSGSVMFLSQIPAFVENLVSGDLPEMVSDGNKLSEIKKRILSKSHGYA
jgi:hypothetical protein